MYADVNYEIITGFYVIGIIINVISTIACPIIADKKGRSVFGWLIGGFFLSLIGLIIVSCLSDLTPSRPYRSTQPFYNQAPKSAPYATKVCDMCGATVSAVGPICENCGNKFTTTTTSTATRVVKRVIKYKCPKCQTLNNTKRCVNCGYDMNISV